MRSNAALGSSFGFTRHRWRCSFLESQRTQETSNDDEERRAAVRLRSVEEPGAGRTEGSLASGSGQFAGSSDREWETHRGSGRGRIPRRGGRLPSELSGAPGYGKRSSHRPGQRSLDCRPACEHYDSMTPGDSIAKCSVPRR
jgi:hypothetical protein